MAERADCRYFEYYTKKRSGSGKNNIEYIPSFRCRIRKMRIEGCLEDCPWFEPR